MYCESHHPRIAAEREGNNAPRRGNYLKTGSDFQKPQPNRTVDSEGFIPFDFEDNVIKYAPHIASKMIA